MLYVVILDVLQKALPDYSITCMPLKKSQTSLKNLQCWFLDSKTATLNLKDSVQSITLSRSFVLQVVLSK